MTDELARRLLGPEARPLACDRCFDELDRYVEWKLAEPDGPFEQCPICEQLHDCAGAYECLAMSAHLQSCPACNEEYASLRDLVLADRSG
jgi:hypothetical protein